MESYEKAMFIGGAVGTLAMSGLATGIAVVAHMPDDWAGVFSFTCGGAGWMIGMWLGVRLDERRVERRERKLKTKFVILDDLEKRWTTLESYITKDLKNFDPFEDDEA